ncbi:hypothetical protein SHKM778_76850 [Streptomyces sp. KM77-8]|uniref:ATP-grasp ribosomal peptide maturase n=1 Tax=Streptomyces haneummycinicus TaxID=3074435 RepID=A0AAT9HVN7_9ACTN
MYHRRPSSYGTDSGEQAARFAAQENRRGLGGVLSALPGCLYLSHPQAIARAEYKPAQLAAATHAGFRVPATLITNDPGKARQFCAEGPTIYKPLHAGAYEVESEPAGIWAAPVGAEDIDNAVSHSAHLFQVQVSKVADVRAVVVGEQVFSARITGPPGVVDWRSEYRSLIYERITCPNVIHRALSRFLAGFGLNFGAFDFAVTADGAWWFLECNPNGQWAWLEDAAGLPITHAIADLLEKERPRHDRPPACEKPTGRPRAASVRIRHPAQPRMGGGRRVGTPRGVSRARLVRVRGRRLVPSLGRGLPGRTRADLRGRHPRDTGRRGVFPDQVEGRIAAAPPRRPPCRVWSCGCSKTCGRPRGHASSRSAPGRATRPRCSAMSSARTT